MEVSAIQLLFIVFGGMILGGATVWFVRGQRINALEKMLQQYKNKLLDLEMEYENLEAFLNHLKEIQQDRILKGDLKKPRNPNSPRRAKA